MTITTIQTAQLTAILLGETGYKRAANREAAEKRFLAVASEKGLKLDTAQQMLAGPYDMAEHVAREHVAGGHQTIEQVKSQPAPVEVAANGTPIEDALRDYHARDDGSDAFMRTLFQRVFDAGAASAAKPARKAAERKPRAEGPNKREIAAALLQREGGCTAKEILEATDWPAVSVPAVAKASGLDLRQEKDGKVTRYWGTAKPAA